MQQWNRPKHATGKNADIWCLISDELDRKDFQLVVIKVKSHITSEQLRTRGTPER